MKFIFMRKEPNSYCP